MNTPIDVTIIGGGMITNDLILPTAYQLQRQGAVGSISICALNSAPLRALKENDEITQAFPGQCFTAFPALSEPGETVHPELYKDVLARMKPHQAVIVALPDQLHYNAVMDALECDQHVLCVKPLVLKYAHSREIERKAAGKALFVGVEYHKRFDRRALLARHHYQQGRFGSFIMGEAKMIEPYYYRASNFQHWFTAGNTDPFVYVGCHYVDLVYFITNLKPVEVAVKGIIGTFPNGNEGYLWTHGRVSYENGAVLSVIDGLGYPDDAAGSNEQNLQMFFEGEGKTGMLKHDDQYRGVEHCYLESSAPEAARRFRYVNPDFFRYVPWEGTGLKPVGYGVDSVSASILTMQRLSAESAGRPSGEACEIRSRIIAEIGERGIIATPGNSFINELVIEAARMSIQNNGRPVSIEYGEQAHVAMAH